MSKYIAARGKTLQPIGNSGSSSGEFGELIQRLFQEPSVVAIVGIGLENGVAGLCEDLAMGLAASGKRVVIVPVDSLLRSETNLISTIGRNVSLWPSPLGRPVDFANSLELDQAGENSWLDALRRNFDSVLLGCPAVDLMFGVTEVAAMADAAILVAQAGRTSKQQIQDDKRALKLRGAKLAGCILLRPNSGR